MGSRAFGGKPQFKREIRTYTERTNELDGVFTSVCLGNIQFQVNVVVVLSL